jgi:hypothetical protein
MLHHDRFVISHACVGPRARGIDHLEEWDSAFAIRAKRDPSRCFGAREKTSRVLTCEQQCAICEKARGSECAAKIGGCAPLLRGQGEDGSGALGGCALNLAAVLIKQRKR